MKIVNKTPTKVLVEITAEFEKLENLVLNLSARWCAERAYEDIEDYKKVIEKELSSKIRLLGVSKKPFGFTFKHLDFIGANYCIYTTGSSYAWKRIA